MSGADTRPRILLVDDEPNLLEGLRRQLLTRLRNLAELKDGVAEPLMVLDAPEVSPPGSGATG